MFGGEPTSPYEGYIPITTAIKVKDHFLTQNEVKQHKIQELEQMFDTLGLDIKTAHRSARWWRDRFLGVAESPPLFAPTKLRRLTDIEELSTLRTLITLIPGSGFLEEKLKGYLLATLPEFGRQATDLAGALNGQRQLENLFDEVAAQRDENSRAVIREEAINEHLGRQLRESRALHNAYQHHALFHPPLGEYERLEVENVKLKDQVIEYERIVTDLTWDINQKNAQLEGYSDAIEDMRWNFRCFRRTCGRSEIQGAFIPLEIAPIGRENVVAEPSSTKSSHKKIRRARRKNKKKNLGRNALESIREEVYAQSRSDKVEDAKGDERMSRRMGMSRRMRGIRKMWKPRKRTSNP